MDCPKCEVDFNVDCFLIIPIVSKTTEIIEETGTEIPLKIELTISTKYKCYNCGTEVITKKEISFYPKDDKLI